jgi:hypothetical protein
MQRGDEIGSAGGVEDQGVPLGGRWRRVTPRSEPADAESVTFGQDSALLPEEIVFGEATYRASKGHGQPFIVWDAGTYVLEDDRLTISLANDALATYQIIRESGAFTVVDENGGRTTYRKL